MVRSLMKISCSSRKVRKEIVLKNVVIYVSSRVSL